MVTGGITSRWPKWARGAAQSVYVMFVAVSLPILVILPDSWFDAICDRFDLTAEKLFGGY